MSTIAVRSVRLSTQTTDAWKEGGVYFARRGRSTEEIMRLGYTNVINLGKSDFAPTDIPDGVRVWNHGNDISKLIWPGSARVILNDLMPPRPIDFPADVWIKAPGAAGRGKFRKHVDHPLVLPKEWDWQTHIEGQEYRLITVGHVVVQDFYRHGLNGEREYEWLRMRDTPTQLKEMAREAARRIPGDNIIAWDMVDGPDGPFIFEGNTCPGVSAPTVRRIMDIIDPRPTDQYDDEDYEEDDYDE